MDVVVYGRASGFAEEIAVGGHRFPADEPTEVGGTDTGPSPVDCANCETKRGMLDPIERETRLVGSESG